MRSSKKINPELVDEIRRLSLFSTLESLDLCWKVDPTFSPAKNRATKLIHVSSERQVFSLLITDSKWFDTLSGVGGGGSIDLTMYLLALDFVGAINLLADKLIRRMS